MLSRHLPMKKYRMIARPTPILSLITFSTLILGAISCSRLGSQETIVQRSASQKNAIDEKRGIDQSESIPEVTLCFDSGDIGRAIHFESNCSQRATTEPIAKQMVIEFWNAAISISRLEANPESSSREEFRASLESLFKKADVAILNLQKVQITTPNGSRTITSTEAGAIIRFLRDVSKSDQTSGTRES